jgi:YegS C-terminal NAD kinase beta sandwich-like domain
VTIRKGEPWGESVPAPVGLRMFDDDRAAGRWLRSLPDVPVEPVGLRGGDLARTMGGGAAGRFDGHVMRAPVDVLRVTLDGRDVFALSHVVLRGPCWSGTVVLLMNAQFLGRRDVAPRSHPNDGRVDVLEVEASMPFRARVQAARRSVRGTHVPHPAISTRQAREWTSTFQRPLSCWVDGERLGRCSSVRVEVVPDCLVVYV